MSLVTKAFQPFKVCINCYQALEGKKGKVLIDYCNNCKNYQTVVPLEEVQKEIKRVIVCLERDNSIANRRIRELEKEVSGLKETLKIMSDKKLLKKIHKSRKDGGKSRLYVPLSTKSDEGYAQPFDHAE